MIIYTIPSLRLTPTDPEDDTVRNIADSDEPPQKEPEDSAVEDIDSRDETPGDKDEEEKDTVDPQDHRSVETPDRAPSPQGSPYS